MRSAHRRPARDRRRTGGQYIHLVPIADESAAGVLKTPIGEQITLRMSSPEKTCSGQSSSFGAVESNFFLDPLLRVVHFEFNLDAPGISACVDCFFITFVHQNSAAGPVAVVSLAQVKRRFRT